MRLTLISTIKDKFKRESTLKTQMELQKSRLMIFPYNISYFVTKD